MDQTPVPNTPAQEASNQIAVPEIVDKALEATLEAGSTVIQNPKKAAGMLPLLARYRSGRLLNDFKSQLNKFREESKIKDDYWVSEQAAEGLSEIFQVLEDDKLDTVRVAAVQAIFFAAAKETLSGRDDPVPTQLMSIAKTLTSGEIIVLATAYRISTEGPREKLASMTSAVEWLQKVAQASGLGATGLVEMHEDGLIRKHLISGRQHSDRSGVEAGQNFRLTDLGQTLCDYLKEGGFKIPS